MQNKFHKVLYSLYQILRNFRYTLLHSFFGMTIHCKHSPTCGTYLFQQMKQRGTIAGFVHGMKRVLQCW